MPAMTAPDGTRLAYRVLGDGPPLVCVPGGPMQDCAYLGDLGGLSERFRLVILELRGTGRSAVPADPTSYRCERLAEDVEALRAELGLDTMNLLGHSAGGNIAMTYAARHPGRIGRLVLLTPNARAIGIPSTVADRRAVLRLRAGEPWFEPVSAAFERINAGHPGDGDWDAIAPLKYGRWDAETQAHNARRAAQVNAGAAEVFVADDSFEPDATRAALATLDAPVLVLAGEVDANSPPRVMAELAGVFPDATLVTLPGAGHFPWLDDPTRLTGTIASFCLMAE